MNPTRGTASISSSSSPSLWLSHRRNPKRFSHSKWYKNRGGVTSFNAFFNWCCRLGYARENPAEGITTHVTDETLAEIFTVDQAKAFLKAAEATAPDICALVALGFFAGIRVGELYRLDWSALNDGHVHVGPAAAKKRRQRFVTVTDNLQDWLRVYRGSGEIWPASHVTMRRRIRAALAKAEIDAWPHNVMRHSFASYHLALHRDAPRTSYELGHTRPDILYDHYRNLATQADAAAYFEIRPGSVAE